VFDDADQELIELLAAHAAIAITNARLYERSRELSMLSERNRLALELHDVVSQKLFGLVLTAESAATLFDRDSDAARAQVQRLQGLAQEALDELRSLVLELRAPDLERDGLCGALREHVDVLARLHATPIDLHADAAVGAGDDARDREVLRIAQEALHNALRHADPARVEIDLSAGDGQVVLQVRDDGRGFDAERSEQAARKLGLTSMRERARAVGGRLAVTSTPGGGTTVRVEVATGG